tara:strand:- start:19 stop:483 length:465 start_codon:yes stop_codon:yes gene_type:complete
MKRIKFFFLILLLLTSCQNSEDTKLISKLIGASIGAAVGSSYGDGVSKNIYTIIGSASGYLLGGKIAELLTEEEKMELNESISDSLENNDINQSSEWTNANNNVKAFITPKQEFIINESTCREFEKVIIKNEKNISSLSKACRDEDGNWKLLDS